MDVSRPTAPSHPKSARLYWPPSSIPCPPAPPTFSPPCPPPIISSYSAICSASCLAVTSIWISCLVALSAARTSLMARLTICCRRGLLLLPPLLLLLLAVASRAAAAAGMALAAACW